MEVDLAPGSLEPELELEAAFERAGLQIRGEVGAVADGRAAGREAEVLAESHVGPPLGGRFYPQTGMRVTGENGAMYPAPA
jgi:hypothetical protein